MQHDGLTLIHRSIRRPPGRVGGPAPGRPLCSPVCAVSVCARAVPAPPVREGQFDQLGWAPIQLVKSAQPAGRWVARSVSRPVCRPVSGCRSASQPAIQPASQPARPSVKSLRRKPADNNPPHHHPPRSVLLQRGGAGRRPELDPGPPHPPRLPRHP